ncbi:chemotaxis protein CheA [Desulfuromonas acetoxidans]|uniref:Chemotaxis protein CheA n=1 Tax=Desulfuromonas acetoxidans (strain DSM 684 / 11070) TaxID=281689 RepID=Q1JZU4_DESA6|nr:chemotaxis protein CheA [Desulfuromonas acetoxidans]EAT15798.1 CheA signal transduction histidine kinases [Desulfuromonas acetoxidans DSM 684]MBF0645000.1 chemotaxis protein CheA [Desulfuromonas acetoxidans]NVD25656.1 chemotaxis protein CheA [Desulfuromonas acetoxidans]NVE17709.1 chemotaxis protein CheA [Desulfuromonas acetoxidans]
MTDELSSDQIEIIQEFVQESQDMIEQLEPTIIELGQTTDNETINAVFRLFHSMKGSAGFLEFNHITSVAHAAESLLDLVRSGKMSLQPEHVTLLCECCDFTKEALETVDEHFTDEAMAKQGEAMATRFHEAMDSDSAAPADEEPVTQEPQTVPEPEAQAETVPQPQPESASEADAEEIDPSKIEATDDLTLEITPEMVERFVQEADELLETAEQSLLEWEKEPDSQDHVALIFRSIHSFKGNSGFFGYGTLEKLSHQIENVLDVVKSGGSFATENPFEVLLNSVDALKDGLNALTEDGRDDIDEIDSLIDALKALPSPRIGEVLVDKGVVDEETVNAALNQQKKPLGDVIVDMGKATKEQVDEALTTQTQTKKPAAPAPRAKPKGSAIKRQDIRVDLEKLDNLINLIGELVIAENMLIHNPDLEGLELESFNKAAQQMGKLVRELQEMAMIIRMIPVSGLFRRMIRLVHDLSVKSGKKVDLKLSGESTEVDKTVIETITDPLVHILRNSMDHGLEPPDERIAAEKDETGVIRLNACHEEGEVWITLEDDGRGLNKEKILAKAITNGLIEGDGSDLTDKEIYNLIFQPGFSTADKITDISGRGVGMDVVKQNLEKIKGKVDVDSIPGKGTKIKLRIPLTLAIIDGMLVRVGTARCIVPILSIKEAFRPQPDAITVTPDNEELVRVRENFFPVVRLHELLETTPEHSDLVDAILIVLEYQGRSICLMVDEIMGQQQTVIKGLSEYIGNVRGCSGCTILGNGDVSLILDVGNLVEMK